MKKYLEQYKAELELVLALASISLPVVAAVLMYTRFFH